MRNPIHSSPMLQIVSRLPMLVMPTLAWPACYTGKSKRQHRHHQASLLVWYTGYFIHCSDGVVFCVWIKVFLSPKHGALFFFQWMSWASTKDIILSILWWCPHPSLDPRGFWPSSCKMLLHSASSPLSCPPSPSHCWFRWRGRLPAGIMYPRRPKTPKLQTFDTLWWWPPSNTRSL